MRNCVIIFAIFITATACNPSEKSNTSEKINPKKEIIGNWKVTDYRNHLLVEQSDAEIQGFESSVKLQREKMIQLAQYTFNENGSYHLQHSPTDFDKGQWLLLNDSLLVQNSELFHTSDTSIVHFNSATDAIITMSDATQSISVEMVKK
jgi:hypothetical protein